MEGRFRVQVNTPPDGKFSFQPRKKCLCPSLHFLFSLPANSYVAAEGSGASPRPDHQGVSCLVDGIGELQEGGLSLEAGLGGA